MQRELAHKLTPMGAPAAPSTRLLPLICRCSYEVLKKTEQMSPEMRHFNTIFVHKSAWPHPAQAPGLPQPEIDADPLNVPPQR